MRGHGKSPNNNTYLNFQKNVNDLVHDIYNRKLENVTIVGHGSGGKIALSLASKHPEIISNLVLLNTTTYSTVPDDMGNPQA